MSAKSTIDLNDRVAVQARKDAIYYEITQDPANKMEKAKYISAMIDDAIVCEGLATAEGLALENDIKLFHSFRNHHHQKIQEAIDNKANLSNDEAKAKTERWISAFYSNEKQLDKIETETQRAERPLMSYCLEGVYIELV